MAARPFLACAIACLSLMLSGRLSVRASTPVPVVAVIQGNLYAFSPGAKPRQLTHSGIDGSPVVAPGPGGSIAAFIRTPGGKPTQTSEGVQKREIMK